MSECFYRSTFFDQTKYISPRYTIEEAMSINNVDCNILTEELHSFEGQLPLTKEVAEHIYWMLTNDVKQQSYHPNHSAFNVINITIDPNDNNSIKASLDGFSIEEKTISMTIKINKLLLGFQSQNILVNRISHVITHELMHGYVFIQQDIPQEDVNIPSTYGIALTIMRHGQYESELLQDLAYALYSTYYQEVQAIISQANTNVNLIIQSRKITSISSQDLVKLTKQTEPYNIFVNNIHVAKQILNMHDEDIRSEIVETLNRYQFQCDEKWIKKQCEYIIKVSQNALKKIIRNSLLIFEK